MTDAVLRRSNRILRSGVVKAIGDEEAKKDVEKGDDGKQRERQPVKRKKKKQVMEEEDEEWKDSEEDEEEEFETTKLRKPPRQRKEKTTGDAIAVGNESNKMKLPSRGSSSSKSKKDLRASGSDKKGEKRSQKKKHAIDVQADSSDGSADEWEEMECVGGGTANDGNTNTQLEITIEASDAPKKEDPWQREMRLAAARREKERLENLHKTHLLCFIAHLRYLVSSPAIGRSTMLRAQALSLIPDGFIAAAQHDFGVAVGERFMKWFRDAFRPAPLPAINSMSVRMSLQMEGKIYEESMDAAVILFLLLRALDLPARICHAARPISFKYKGEKNANGSDEGTIEEKNASKSDKGKKKREEKTGKMTAPCYWNEYWHEESRAWICVDPCSGAIDHCEQMIGTASVGDEHSHYVIAADSDGGVRDLSAKYLPRFLSSAFRRGRIDQAWWNATIKTWRGDRSKERVEDVRIHEMLMARPRPVAIADYKNHPLYALKRDLLKYQAIYPPDEKPIGRIRDQEIYSRSSVHTLHCKEVWLKDARVIKGVHRCILEDSRVQKGVEPYKVVNARPKMNELKLPKEQRVNRPLNLFGFWQTEEYEPPVCANGRVPRNQFGNVELFKPSMLPHGAVHLRLHGLAQIARRLGIDCVPAVTGWDFHSCVNHPVLDGFVVCEEFADTLKAAWREQNCNKNEQRKMKCQQRAIANWKRLTKGLRTLAKVRKQFAKKCESPQKPSHMTTGERLEDDDDDQAIEDPNCAWPRTSYVMQMPQQE